DALVAAMRELTSANVVTFGLGAGDVRASDVVVDDDLRAVFRLESPWGATGIALRARGEHQVANALAAAAAALAMDATLDGVARGRARATRSRVGRGRTGMIALLLSAGMAFLVALAGTPVLIRWLRAHGIGQQIRDDGPEGHVTKAGTPTMGGVMIVGAAF